MSRDDSAPGLAVEYPARAAASFGSYPLATDSQKDSCDKVSSRVSAFPADMMAVKSFSRLNYHKFVIVKQTATTSLVSGSVSCFVEIVENRDKGNQTMRNKPRRATKRWLDGDCPDGVLAIFDDPRAIDRYTVFYREPITDDGNTFAYVAMNAAPFHPQGFGQHGELDAHQVRMFRYRESHRACRWSDLPDDCKRLVRQDLAT